MKIISLCALLICGVLIIGCATTFRLIPKSNEQIKTYYLNDYEYAISRSKNSIAIAMMYSDSGNVILKLFITNISKNNINFFPENIKVVCTNRDKSIKYLKVYSAREYIDGIKTAQTISLLTMALSGVLKYQYAGETATVSAGTAYDLKGNTVNYSTSSKSVDYVKKQQAANDNVKMLSEYESKYNNYNEMLEHVLLKRNTVMSGYSIEGSMMIEYYKTNDYTLFIPFGDDTHIINFEIEENIKSNEQQAGGADARKDKKPPNDERTWD